MVRPIGESSGFRSLSFCCCWARDRAAASIAGLSRKLPACCCAVSRERTSRSRSSSAPHAFRRNASRSSGVCSNTACSRLSIFFQRSESIDRTARELSIEPGLGGAPVPHHGDGRYLEHLGRLFYAESAKEAHFDDLHLTRIEPRQRVHRIVERHQVRRSVAAHHGRLFQRNMLHAASSLQVMTPRMFNQNAPHQLS